MHLVDTLDAGGAERMAVNITNALPEDRYQAFLCTTRRDGELARLVASHVGRVRLERRNRFDLSAFRRLLQFIKSRDIRLLHAHGAAVFIAVAASRRAPYPAVLWHDHYGRHETHERPRWLYRQVVNRCSGVIAVTDGLAAWARDRLGVPAPRICYLPNFVAHPETTGEVPALPGRAGARIVCVANLRPQKDHPTLVHAMAHVRTVVPEAHLLLAGSTSDDTQVGRVREIIEREGLERHVSLLGSRTDLPGVMRGCDIGVLSSVSEGLPLALLEYGTAGLAVVATEVGQVADVLDNGRAGILLPPGNSSRLAEALISLLRSPERRNDLGQRLQSRVATRFGTAPAMDRLRRFYDDALAREGHDARVTAAR